MRTLAWRGAGKGLFAVQKLKTAEVSIPLFVVRRELVPTAAASYAVHLGDDFLGIPPGMGNADKAGVQQLVAVILAAGGASVLTLLTANSSNEGNAAGTAPFCFFCCVSHYFRME